MAAVANSCPAVRVQWVDATATPALLAINGVIFQVVDFNDHGQRYWRIDYGSETHIVYADADGELRCDSWQTLARGIEIAYRQLAGA